MLIGGEGPPLLLLHGFPQNHVMWHLVAPQLARRFTVVVPDLRGYGYSRGPAPDPEHRNYSKRAMAIDMVGVMAGLGHQTFFVAGHDRGGRVAYRLALDHPARVLRLAVLDILPTWDVWQAMNAEAALRSYHWLLLAQPAPLPEQLIGHDPDSYVRHLLERWAGRPDALDPAAVAQYLQQFHQSSVIDAACEDYRAGATIDREDDHADRLDGARINCPLLVLWGQRSLGRQGPVPLDVWRTWARDVRDIALDCGHFLAEEEPEPCADALGTFFERASS
jgi:haloacetate dehalogenase